MKIEFAPRSIPFDRRLQTASVIQWVFSFLGLAQCCIAIFFALLFTRFWLISILYAAWWAIDWETPSRGGRKIHWLRNGVVWRYMKNYFPITIAILPFVAFSPAVPLFETVFKLEWMHLTLRKKKSYRLEF